MGKYIYDNTLVGKHRAFKQDLYEKYDIPARDKIKRLLGDFVVDNPNPYEQDLIITDKTCKYKYLELQVCINWIGEKYPYDKVCIYERKSKYDGDTLFLTLNHDLSFGHLFDTKNITDDTKPRRLKKYSREFVYDIPWHKVLTIPMQEMAPEIIKMY